MLMFNIGPVHILVYVEERRRPPARGARLAGGRPPSLVQVALNGTDSQNISALLPTVVVRQHPAAMTRCVWTTV